MRRRIVRYTAASTSPIPFRGVAGGRAPHGLDDQRSEVGALATQEPAVR